MEYKTKKILWHLKRNLENLDYKAEAIILSAYHQPIIVNGVDNLIYHEAGRNRMVKAKQAIRNIEFCSAKNHCRI